MTPSLALSLVFTFGWIPLFVYRTESPTDAWHTLTRGERWWTVLTPIALTIHLTLACVALSLVPVLPPWRAAVAAALFVTALGFWFWARALIGPWRARRLPDEPPLRFRRDGAFGVVRNPLYLGVLAAALAPVVAAGRPFLLVTYAACGIALAVRCRQDEQRLHQLVGAAYADYCRDVRSLIPFVW